MIPLAIPNLGGNEGRYLQECVDSTFVSSVGPFVNRFEQAVADAAGAAAPGVATSSGTTGLHAALTAVGVRQGDLVVLPTYTFIASANAISQCGAIPWLLDVEPIGLTLSAQDLELALAEEAETVSGQLVHRATGRRVAAVMPVHALGAPADMDSIVASARSRRLPVVADAAAALGAHYKGRPVGTLGADLAVFSFNGNKTVTGGGGGAVVGEDAALVDRVRHLTTTARIGPGYHHDVAGFNYRMTSLQAAVALAQMERLEEFVAIKRTIAQRYDEAFADLEGVTGFKTPDWGQSACWLSGVVLDPRRHPDTERVRDRLRERGVDARPFWKPVHLQPPYADAPRETTSVSDAVWETMLPLPCSTGLTDEELAQVIGAVRTVLAGHG